MALEDVKLTRLLLNDSNEAWLTYYYDRETMEDWEFPPPTPPSGLDCLQYRIARYVTHQGPFPFIRTSHHDEEHSETDRGSERDPHIALYDDRGFGWKWLPDESWYYESHFLSDYQFI